jgi:signal transduction histidine kinase
MGELPTSTIASLLRLGTLAGQGRWEETLQDILLVTAGAIGVERVSYWRFRDEPASIVCELGYDTRGHRFERGFVLRETDAAPYLKAVQTTHVMSVVDARRDPRTHGLEVYLAARGVGSLLDTVIRARGNPVGILCIEHVGEPRSWTSQEQEFAFAVAQILSTKIEADARDEAERRVHEAQVLEDATAAMAESFEPCAAAQVAVQRAVPALAHWAKILVYDGKRVTSMAEAYLRPIEGGVKDAIREATPIDLEGPGFFAHAMREQQTLFLPEVTPEIAKEYGVEGRYYAALAALPLRSVIAAPFVVRGELTGALMLASIGTPFGQTDLRFAERYALRVSVMLENARLYQKSCDAIGVRDEFLSLAAHELRTPITSLRLFAQQLAQKAPQMTSSAVIGLSNRILRQAERLERMADRLLDTSEIGRGRPSIDRAETDLGQIVEDVTHAFDDTALRAGSELTLSIRGPVVGRWDPIRLEQIVANLLDNAIKFGDGKPIRVELESAGEKARLSIRDEGGGISREDEPHVFERYWRASEHRSVGGLGLGLYVVKEMTEAHGGSVTLERNSTGGSTFVLELPLAPPKTTQPQPQGSSTI